MNATTLLAKKYATAFLHIFGGSFSMHEYTALHQAISYLQTKRALLVLLSIPTLTLEQKKQCLAQLLSQAHMPTAITPLAHLLLEHQRIELLALVCTFIQELYQEQKNIMPFTIKSAYPLSEDHVSTFKKYLAQKTGNTILATPIVDKALIAGIRAESKTFLWESSIAKQLRALKNNEL